MSTRIVRCSALTCREAATVKIAAPWSYGRFRELKTYGFACPEHLATVLRHAESKPKPSWLAEGEEMGSLSAYPLDPN